ncbi:MAG: molybdate transport system substrate-binding protein [Chloroflexota bacterium]|jgi:molybdate transport system substrate-binding protein|nr:molybdate transport system substrate-binding protein [Chloroflexota bacterium]
MVEAVRILGIVAVATVVAGCGGSSVAPASPSPSGRASTLTGPLTVLAAASLTEAFTDARKALEAGNPGLAITDSFAGSQQLVSQIQSGAPADVVATADQASITTLASAGLVDTPTVFAHNTLEIVVAPGNPRGVRGLADLARPDLIVVLEDPSVPAGKFARQALQKAGITVAPRSLELDVKSELQKVAMGEADAGIVYVTDVSAAGSRVTGVPIPDGQNVTATYPVAVVKASRHPAAARAFVGEIVSGAGQRALRARGFLGP